MLSYHLMQKGRHPLWLFLCVLVGAVAACRGACQPEPTAKPTESPPKGQLPEGVTPMAYLLSLTVDPSSERFSGRVSIDVRLDRPRSVIWLHGKDVDVRAASFTLRGAQVLAAKYEQVGNNGIARLTLPKSVGPGNGVLVFDFSAPFSKGLNGLYSVEAGGHHYAFTQFESISARMCFPGFDEPRFKTPFTVELTVAANDKAISSAPHVGEQLLPGGRKRVRFATTKPIPTYLLALAVGPFDVIKAPAIAANRVRKRPLPLRGVAVKGKAPLLSYALGHTPAFMDLLERYVGEPYPFAKLDIIAVPDLKAGAMENVGAITFRDSRVLIDPETASVTQKRRCDYTNIHEIAHMWFGNQVTMRWWDDLWLNEAFASWLEYVTVRDWRPTYRPYVKLLEKTMKAMEDDALVSARQIRQPIESEHDIANAFDSITYSKGAAVLSMFERYWSRETMQKVIRDHVSSHRFGTASSEDFLASVTRAAGPDNAAALRTFVMQPGVPLLDVQLQCEAGRPALTVKQSRYLPLGSRGDPDQSWQLPICFRYGLGAKGDDIRDACALIKGKTATLPIDANACPAWLMPNADGAGYYRWVMTEEQMTRLTAHADKLTDLERVSLIDNVAAALLSNRLPAATALETVVPFADNPDRLVLQRTIGLVERIHAELVGEPQKPRLAQWARRLYRPALARVGLKLQSDKGEAGEVKLARGALVTLLAGTGDDSELRETLGAAGKAAIGFGGDGRIHRDGIDSNLLPTALMVAVQDGGSPVFEAVLTHLNNSDDGWLRRQLLTSLAAANDAALSKRARQLTLEPGVLRSNEIYSVLETQLERREHRDVAWVWLQEHLDELIGHLPTGQGANLPSLLDSFCSHKEAKKMEAFFTAPMAEQRGGPRNLASALEKVRLCATYKEAQRASAEAFFQSER